MSLPSEVKTEPDEEMSEDSEEMSEDSGCLECCSATPMDTSSVDSKSLSADSTALSTQTSNTHQFVSVNPVLATNVGQSIVPGQGYASNRNETILPKVKTEPTIKTEKLDENTRRQTGTVSGAAGQKVEVKTELEYDEISEDSGFVVGSSASSMEASSVGTKSLSVESTATLTESVQASVKPEILSTHVGCNILPGQGYTINLTKTNLPTVKEDPKIKTEKLVEETFEVFVKNLDGKTHTIKVDMGEDVSVFRNKVCQKLGVPGQQQRLTSQNGRTLEDGHCLSEYDIKKHSTIYCQGRLRGGIN